MVSKLCGDSVFTLWLFFVVFAFFLSAIIICTTVFEFQQQLGQMSIPHFLRTLCAPPTVVGVVVLCVAFSLRIHTYTRCSAFARC